jgi:hypothetical protein
MSFEKALSEMIRRELTAQLHSLQKSVTQLERGLSSLQSLREVTGQLAPLLRQQGREVVLRHAQARAAPERAAPAKAPERVAPAKAPERVAPAKAPARRGRVASTAARQCAVIGCKRPARSKGYCSAHYQKLRLLIRTHRRPADWVDDAAPHSAKEVKLPRGRAAGREKQAAPAAPKEPPKPKAWVRKKGGAGMVSLH